MSRLLALILLLSLSGCATIVSGTDQVVSVSSVPPGATCSVKRGSSPLGIIATTPGILPVSKSISALDVSCAKPGYMPAQASLPSSFNGWTFGNLVIGGIVGMAVDMSTGANFDYPRVIDVAMTPDPSAVEPPTARRSFGADAPMRIAGASRQQVATRMMGLPDASSAKHSFLLGACSAGDMTACILAETGGPARRRHERWD